MIFPSLYNLLADGLLPDDFLIIASGRSEFTDEEFRADIDKALRKFLAADRYDAEIAERLRAILVYQPVEAGNAAQFTALGERRYGRLDKGVTFYRSPPLSFFAPTEHGTAEAGLT